MELLLSGQEERGPAPPGGKDERGWVAKDGKRKICQKELPDG